MAERREQEGGPAAAGQVGHQAPGTDGKHEGEERNHGGQEDAERLMNENPPAAGEGGAGPADPAEHGGDPGVVEEPMGDEHEAEPGRVPRRTKASQLRSVAPSGRKPSTALPA